ncbi:hypothetical protein H310_12806 [Aphanomyces invadans]|uniref:UBC core domain-containing protein n=1 Tax=Aphanomyces invadans TaxID=157072 RepID=A0A024TIL6_9STRA|nr:hypothetical protein H310_12806 [Aphanomyces invadans]ETV93207.1 hypothetical protein H310_12806 [Aphanomyces invadans]|eukprot:XP_008878229.1 hypothetical protein H310_12806 [Aphanomyces invadans]
MEEAPTDPCVVDGVMGAKMDFAPFRVRKDLNELAKGRFVCSHATTQIEFPDGTGNILHILISISVGDVDSPYANGDFRFQFDIPRTYPFHAPVVKSLDKIWHPNIDINTGQVMFSILGNDWRPVLSINTILLGLQLIFLEPSIEFAVNQVAATTLVNDPQLFRRQVQHTLCGGAIYGVEFLRHPRQRLHVTNEPVNRLHCKRERELEREIEHMTISQSMDCEVTDEDSDHHPDGPAFKRHRGM